MAANSGHHRAIIMRQVGELTYVILKLKPKSEIAGLHF